MSRFKAKHADERCGDVHPETTEFDEGEQIVCELNKDHDGKHQEEWESTNEVWKWDNK